MKRDVHLKQRHFVFHLNKDHTHYPYFFSFVLGERRIVSVRRSSVFQKYSTENFIKISHAFPLSRVDFFVRLGTMESQTPLTSC